VFRQAVIFYEATQSAPGGEMETSRSKTLWTRIVMRQAMAIAEEIKADAILFYMDSTKDISPFLNFKSDINTADVRESLKEFSAIDGAFLIRGDGVVLAAGRHLNVVYQGPGLPQGLGTRHAAGAAITGVTNSIAMVISESTGKVTLFRNGQSITTIDRGIVPVRPGPLVD
jgi:hypothetical protein